MSEEGDKLVVKAQEKLRDLESQVIKTKEFINQVREFDGHPPLYTDLSIKPATSGPITSGQFFGRPLATVVREVLEMRRATGQGAASVNEIYSKLIEGAYKFDTANEDNAKRSLRISLTKNPAFLKIPNGDYGLAEWYPNARAKRDRAENGHDAEPEQSANGDGVAATEHAAE